MTASEPFIKYVARLITDAERQQRANRKKKRQLRSLRAEVKRLRAACGAANDVFNELDDVSWPQSERDQFHGEAGECPVNYDGAHGLVADAVSYRKSN